jgi:hypothetical protein
MTVRKRKRAKATPATPATSSTSSGERRPPDPDFMETAALFLGVAFGDAPTRNFAIGRLTQRLAEKVTLDERPRVRLRVLKGGTDGP